MVKQKVQGRGFALCLYWNYKIMKYKYPVGTKVRFLYTAQDTGKIGTIVGFRSGGQPVIFLPTSKSIRRSLFKGVEFTWRCEWNQIEPIGQQQLLFEFMNE